jgi:hypothetical protein
VHAGGAGAAGAADEVSAPESLVILRNRVITWRY